MHSIPRSTDRRNITSSPITEGTGAGNGTLRRLFVDRTIRCWLCVIALGTAGCIFGARMPYAQSSAVAMSVLWWGFYFGCFGWGISVWISLFTERTPDPPSEGADGPFPPVGFSHDVKGANRTPRGSATPATVGTPAIAPSRSSRNAALLGRREGSGS
jgi:hypothetical protein